MGKMEYASPESQLGNAPCLCEDTEEMFLLREADDYRSKVRLGNMAGCHKPRGKYIVTGGLTK